MLKGEYYCVQLTRSDLDWKVYDFTQTHDHCLCCEGVPGPIVCVGVRIGWSVALGNDNKHKAIWKGSTTLSTFCKRNKAEF